MGLLFGTMQNAIVTVHTAKVFPTSLNDPLSADSFSKFRAIARSEPELASLDLVGWCAVQQAVGLLPNEIDFHNRHFRRLSDIALLVTPETKAGFSAGLHMKSGDEVSTGDNFRCAAHYVTCKAPASAPVELRVSTPIDEGPYSKVLVFRRKPASELDGRGLRRSSAGKRLPAQSRQRNSYRRQLWKERAFQSGPNRRCGSLRRWPSLQESAEVLSSI
jgi:hypothetical protein